MIVIKDSIPEIILNMRGFLIDEIIKGLMSKTEHKKEGNQEILEEIINYLQLKKILSKRLNRVI